MTNAGAGALPISPPPKANAVHHQARRGVEGSVSTGWQTLTQLQAANWKSPRRSNRLGDLSRAAALLEQGLGETSVHASALINNASKFACLLGGARP
jgi:hypothetical protein